MFTHYVTARCWKYKRTSFKAVRFGVKDCLQHKAKLSYTTSNDVGIYFMLKFDRTASFNNLSRHNVVHYIGEVAL